jgi:head-tail adaptor
VGYSEYVAATGQAVESMSFGKMNTQIQITQKQVTLDDEGFQTESDVVAATVRAYREGRHGSEKWANRAAFSEATDLFRFRTIPGVRISTDMRLFCDGIVFEITSVEDVKGRGMYIEALAKEVQPSG